MFPELAGQVSRTRVMYEATSLVAESLLLAAVPKFVRRQSNPHSNR